MDFVNKGFSSLITVALMIITIVFLFNILPIVLIAIAGIWGISWIVKKVKAFIKTKKVLNNKFEDIEVVSEFDTSEKTVIDVEYTEIK